MTALITGASEGMGRDMALILAQLGYDLILVSRSEAKLWKVALECGGKAKVITLDLSVAKNARSLYEQTKDLGVDILINNAGFGAYGEFASTDLDSELNMIDLNIKALHILTKLFVRDFIARDSGTILNVASLAAFYAGPLHAGYYASKSYVLHLTEAIYEELRRKGSKVTVCCFCPGPVRTAFNDKAGAGKAIVGIDSSRAAAYAIRQMLKKKLIIMPDWRLRAMTVLQRFLPIKAQLKLTYWFQMKRK